MIHHTSGDICPSCEEKLQLVHPILCEWFDWAKSIYIDIHIAWGWRDEANQHADYLAKRSKFDWPDSKHNNMLAGKGCSLALDVFQLDDNKAHFDPKFYQELNQKTIDEGWPIIWGGTWHSFKDMDHFEMKENIDVT